MEKDFLRLNELWNIENPTKLEISELYELCSKYLNIDLLDLVYN